MLFQFGGKLVSFDNTSKTVKVQQLTTESGLVERANALERSLAEANYSEYCRQRADETADQHGRYVWYFIKANFDLNPKEEMLNLLGKIILFHYLFQALQVQVLSFRIQQR